MEDRRRAKRVVASFPVAFQQQRGWAFLTVAKNVAPRGMLVMTAASMEVGTPVRVSYQTEGEDGPVRRLEGKIVRVSDNEGEDRHEWPFVAAVELPEGLPDYERYAAEGETEGETEGSQ